MESVKRINVALVSPGDVAEERQTVANITAGLNQWTSGHGYELRLKRWEDVTPGFDPDGIDSRIQDYLDIPNCDLVIGVFWKRYGEIDDPPYSRTAREILKAIAAKGIKGTPEVMVYFSRETAVASTEEERKQSVAVDGFKAELKAKGVLVKEYEPKEFNTTLIGDLLKQLDIITKQPGPSKELSCSVTCSESLVRSNGYSELLGDVRLRISGVIPLPDNEAQVEIAVVLSTHASGRRDSDGFLDATVSSESRGTLARGTQSPPRTNMIRFEAIPLGRGGSRIDETLTIRGIRGDCTIVHKISALIEVTFADPRRRHITLLREDLTVASVCEPMTFSAEPYGPQTVSNEPAEKRGHSLMVHFEPGFPGAFRTQEQEGISGISTADQGTICMVVLHGVPTGLSIFATSNEVRSGHQQSLAAAILTDSSGLPTERNSGIAGVTWQGQTMIEIQSFTNASGKFYIAAWEIINPEITGKRKLSFGLALVGTTSEPFTIFVAGSMAPSYSSAIHLKVRTANSTFPVPRFKWFLPPVGIAFDSAQEPA